MNQEKCKRCSSKMLNEIPGLFYDFDADFTRHGSLGIALCSKCLGTGVVIETPEFKKLGEEVSEIRQDSFKLQINASKNKLPSKELMLQLKKNNEELIEIARKALKIILNPVENCYAQQLIK